MPLKYDFVPYSPGSRRLIDFAEADMARADFDAPDGVRALIEQCEQDARDTIAQGERRIERGSVTAAEVARQAAVFRAIAADLRAERAHHAACRAHCAAGCDIRELPILPDYAALGRLMVDDDEPPIGWEEKVHVLRRAIHFRRKFDPERVRRGRLDPAEARRALERLEAIQEKYFEQLFAWASPAGAELGTPPWRAEIRAHLAAIDAARNSQAAEPALDVIPAQAGTHEHGSDQEAQPA